MIIVRYIGPGAAILGGSYIYAGEARAVTLAQLDQARCHHPQGFEVVGGEAPAEPTPGDDELPLVSASSETVPPSEQTLASTPAPVESSQQELPSAPAAVELSQQEPIHERQPERSHEPIGERRGGRERRTHGRAVRSGR